MSQNSNKLSSIIGLTLLLLVIGFTVFINQKSETISEEKEEVNSEEPVKEEILEKTYFTAFDKEDVENFWKLENFKTDSMNVVKNENRTSIQIQKLLVTIKTKTYNNVKDEDTFNKLNDSLETVYQKKYGVNYRQGGWWTSHPTIPSVKTHLVYCGTLVFSYQNQDNDSYGSKVFENFETEPTTKKTFNLTEIGNIFIKYQIRKVYTDLEEIGDFTVIVLADGKKIFLIKENAAVRGGRYFEELLRGASYINDSTRITFH